MNVTCYGRVTGNKQLFLGLTLTRRRVENWFLRRFQQLRLYCNEIERGTGKKFPNLYK